MVKLAYTISIYLKDSLNTIESLRHHILLTPLAPRHELRLRWEAMVNRVYWSMSLDSKVMKKSDIIAIFTRHSKSRLSADNLAVLDYKKAFDYLSYEWLVNTKPVTSRVIETIHALACSHSKERGTRGIFKTMEQPVKQLLEYLQTQGDHPIVQSALAHLQFHVLSPFGEESAKVARLVTYVFLYKQGYDVRGLLVLEEWWRRDLVAHEQALASFGKENNANQWLDYFVQGVLGELEKMSGEIGASGYRLDVPSTFFELNDRQRTIVTQLEQPQATITNRKVQQLSGVSQITASRDLGRLAALGLIYPHGKGRSVYYTRV